MLAVCKNCSEFIFLGGHDVIFDITCKECLENFCGMCHGLPHYPAECADLQNWEDRFILYPPERIAHCTANLETLDQVMDALDQMEDNFQTIDDVHRERFSSRLQLPFYHVREILRFARCYQLHAFNYPYVGEILNPEWLRIVECIRSFVESVPHPGMTAVQWRNSLPNFRYAGINVGVPVIFLIQRIPFARNALRALQPGSLVADETDRELEREQSENMVMQWHAKLIS